MYDLSKSLPFAFDKLMRPTKFVKVGSLAADLSINFFARPTGIYLDAKTTVATLSVQGLPELSPNTFEVNAAEGFPPAHFEGHFGGSTSLTMPDGESGTLEATWFLSQTPVIGTVGGGVGYSTHESSKPFLGANKIQIKVVMQLLRALSFDGPYEWSASGSANIPRLQPPDGVSIAKSGTAVTGDSLTFTLDVTMNPPSANFTAD